MKEKAANLIKFCQECGMGTQSVPQGMIGDNCAGCGLYFHRFCVRFQDHYQDLRTRSGVTGGTILSFCAYCDEGEL